MQNTQVQFNGIPHMSGNCWRSIEAAVRARPQCRYLEWGSGNSTIALLRLVLDNPGLSGLKLHSIENDPGFANGMFDAIAQTFRHASVDGAVRIEWLGFSKPSFFEALRGDPVVSRYEAHLLKLLWYTRNDGFWSAAAQPSASQVGRYIVWRRYLIRLQCSAAFRWERFRRALARSGRVGTVTTAGTAQSPKIPRLNGPTRVTFDTERVRFELLLVPQLRNWLWRRGPILDGLYQEFADYVSAPLEGQFDVVLVDGRARTSCLKRIHHDVLLAPGGVLFLHDAHRPFHHEALQLFGTWSYVRGSNVRLDGAPLNADQRGGQLPFVRSGPSMQQVEAVFDRELYFYEAPASGNSGVS